MALGQVGIATADVPARGWASKIRAHSASKQPRPRKSPPVVRTTWAQERYPDEETGDPGSVIAVHYTFEDNVVTLTNEKGAPVGGKGGSYVLQHGESAERIAKLLAMAGRERPSRASVDVAWVV